MINVSKNVMAVRTQIRDHEIKYAREKNSVLLLAVSKGQSIEKILEASKAGQTAFGENYLQEALPKMTALADKSFTWHFIGPLQSNKTKKVAEHFDWVHTVASHRSAKRLSEQRPAMLAPLNICLQVNISQEPSKAGLHPNDVLTVAEYCQNLPQIKLRGLMAIPNLELEFAKQRAAFHALHLLYKQLLAKGFEFDTLSMGMSLDLEAAVAEGTTLVRVGTAIFGERHSK
jgi:pyridoxal phosphate enzyme (YggS family)